MMAANVERPIAKIDVCVNVNFGWARIFPRLQAGAENPQPFRTAGLIGREINRARASAGLGDRHSQTILAQAVNVRGKPEQDGV